jgi:predicted ferric reductase
MSPKLDQPITAGEPESTISFGHFALIMLVAFLSALITVSFLPDWLPGLTDSLIGSNISAYWYLSRGSAVIAYLLLWLSMILGTGITNKLGALWPGLPSTIEMHEYTSILGLAFGIFHGLILLGDHYISFSLVQILVPFATTSYKPIAVGIGQVALYIWALLDISFYIRKTIGKKMWRAIHFGSFLTYASVLFHAIISGTDASTTWLQLIYWITGGILAFMITYRILASLAKAREKRMRLQALTPKIPVQ